MSQLAPDPKAPESLEAVMNFANWPAPQPLSFAVDAVVPLPLSPALCFSCQALAAETKTHLRTQIKQNKTLASENNLPQSRLLVLLNRL